VHVLAAGVPPRVLHAAIGGSGMPNLRCVTPVGIPSMLRCGPLLPGLLFDPMLEVVGHYRRGKLCLLALLLCSASVLLHCFISPLDDIRTIEVLVLVNLPEMSDDPVAHGCRVYLG